MRARNDATGGVDVARAQTALADVVPRLTALLRAGGEPKVPALGEWNVAEVATHLSQAWALVPSLARGERSSPLQDLWSLADLTKSYVRADPERDLSVLADRIDASAAEFQRFLASPAPSDVGPWLVEGVTAPPEVFACHLLNECLVHGDDIARATGRVWTIDRTHAALVFEGFVFPIVASLDRRAVVDQRRAAGVRATYDIRLRGAGGAFFVFDDGALSVEPPSARRVDCHISADPLALLLVYWGRRSQWSAITAGQLLAWGRRPWLGLRLNALLRRP